MSYSEQQHKEFAGDFFLEYTIAGMKSGFEQRIRQFFVTEEAFLQAQGVPAMYFELAISKTNWSKSEYSLLTAFAFYNKAFYWKFHKTLAADIQQILDALVWEKSLSQDDILERFNIEICDVEERRYSKTYAVKYNRLKKPFFFFNQQNHKVFGAHTSDGGSYSLYLPQFLREHIAKFYELPEAGVIQALDEIPTTSYLYETGQEDVFAELDRILVYKEQGQIKTSKRGKVQVSTLSKMQRKLRLQEFYPIDESEKVLKTLRSGLLASLIVKSNSRHSSKSSLEVLKQLVKYDYLNNYESVLSIMTYLKGSSKVSNYYIDEKTETKLLNIVNQLPVKKWVSVDNISASLKYNFVKLQPITNYAASSSLYYELIQTFDSGRQYVEQEYVKTNRYDRVIVEPLLKGTLFLFASLGMLDIAYEMPDLQELGKTAYSQYDGLQYVRLNELGAYLLDRVTDYQVPESTQEATLKLSEESLTIVVDQNDPTAALLLEPFTKKVTANRFRTDANIFLTGCNNKRDLELKIVLFRQSISQELPSNWVSFFNELQRKIDPLTLVEDITIFKIPTDNTVLVRLIAKDATFREMVMKAEGYQILVANKNLARFKQRLREFGYLLSQ